jgi:hypothetical protein
LRARSRSNSTMNRIGDGTGRLSVGERIKQL